MKIIFHTRHAELAEDFEGIAEEKLLSLSRFSVLIDSIKVEIQHEGNPSHGKRSHHVTLTTHGAGPFLRSEGVGFNDLAAFDEAVANLQLQIRRLHERSKDVQHESVVSHLLVE